MPSPSLFRPAALQRRTVAAAFLLVVVAGCGAKNEFQPPPPPAVTVANPVRKVIQRTLEFTGTTRPIEKVDIRARVAGFLKEVKFTDGQAVEAGQSLFQIDPEPFATAKRQAVAAQRLAEAQAKSATADFARTKAELDNANAQLARGQRAAEGGAVTAGELDDLRTTRDAAYATAAAAQAAIASANAQIEAAKAEVERAELDLGYANVLAPIAGRVGESLVDVGNLVGSSDPTHLTTIVQYDPIYAYYTISEADLLMWLDEIKEGKKYKRPTEKVDEELPVRLGLANEEGYPHEGFYDYADLGVDSSSGTFEIRARFDNKNRDIPPGAFVRIQVPMEEEEALLVDERAIGRDQGGTFVLVVVNQEGGPTVERRVVKLAETFEHMRIVESGLTVEDRVIVNGLQRARPGVVVTPTEAAPAGETMPASTDDDAANGDASAGSQ